MLHSPAPSSAEAKLRGCLCPELQNGHDGLGIEWGETWTVWGVRSDCPLHGGNLPSDSQSQAERHYTKR